MACRGVHFAILPGIMERLIEATSDRDVLTIIQDEIEEEWDQDHLYQTDKAWDAIHRCLTDGKLAFDNGDFPLNAAILGGKQLYRGDDYVLSLVRPEQVPLLAAALAEFDKDKFSLGYSRIDQSDYQGKIGHEDLDYAWNWFNGLALFFANAAAEGRAVIFTVD